MYKIYDICRYYNLENNKNINDNEILSFFDVNKKILLLDGEKLETELAYNWTHNKFINLLLCIKSLSTENIEIIGEKIIDITDSVYLEEIRKNIFNKNSFEELYNKFIIPKSILVNDVDYGYSLENKKYAANLTYSLDEVNSISDILSSIFENNNDISMERRRSIRKKGFELLFTGLIKNPNIKNDKQFVEGFFKNMDEVLKNEKNDSIDDVYGSIHNVLYGFISHSNKYKNPNIGFESKSIYSFIPMVYPLMQVLNKLIITNISIKNDK